MIAGLDKEKHYIFLLASFLLLGTRIEVGAALQRTYEWTHLLYGEPNHYQAYVTTSDEWYVGIPVNVTLKVALITKGPRLDYTQAVHVRILIQGSRFTWESADVQVDGRLEDEGDFWEKSVSFNMPAEKAARGQTENLSISFELTYNEIDNIDGHSLQTIYGPTTYEALYVSLYSPLLSAHELIATAALIGLVLSGVAALLILRRRGMSAKNAPTSNPQLTRAT